MACDCMRKITDQIVKDQPFPDLKITRAQFNQVLAFPEMKYKPVLEVELTCEGRKKPATKSIAYSFCPFCGNEYNSKNANEQEVPA